MDRENYEILGLDENATTEEVEARYRELKAKYDEEKWQDGEAGNAAARKLSRIKAAYEEIMEERRAAQQAQENANSSPSGAFDEVGNAIRAGDLNRAQQLLDAFNERNAEWHYLQSVVFYKKNWMNESKKQLEIAIQLDGNNEKYKEAYEKLKSRAEYTRENGGAPNTNPDPNYPPPGSQAGGNWCSTCATMCYTYLCVDCLCNLCMCGMR